MALESMEAFSMETQLVQMLWTRLDNVDKLTFPNPDIKLASVIAVPGCSLVLYLLL